MSCKKALIVLSAVLALPLAVLPEASHPEGAGLPAEVVWQGDIWVNESVIFQPNQTLIILPGTTVHIKMVAASCTEGSAPMVTAAGNFFADGNGTARIRFETYSSNGTPCTAGREAVLLYSNGTSYSQSITRADFQGGALLAFRANLTLNNCTFNYTPVKLSSDSSVIEDCRFTDSPLTVFPTSATVIRNNFLGRTGPDDVGIYLYDGVAVRGNTITNCLSGIEASVWVSGDITGNTITGCSEAVNSTGALNISGNTLTGNGIGVRSWTGMDIISGNLLAGNDIGVITLGHSPATAGNTFSAPNGTGNRRADIQEMLIASGAVLDGNGQPQTARVTVKDAFGSVVYFGDPEFMALTAYEKAPGGAEMRYPPFTATAELAGATNSTTFNGTYNTSFTIRLDLLPDLSFVSFKGPAGEVRPGELVRIRFAVQNTGNVSARGFRVLVTIDGKQAFLRQLTSLGPGEVHNYTFDWSAEEGRHDFKAVLDPAGGVGELSEKNNQRSFSAEVRPAQKLPPMSSALMLVLLIGAALTATAVVSRD